MEELVCVEPPRQEQLRKRTRLRKGFGEYVKQLTGLAILRLSISIRQDRLAVSLVEECF